MPEKSYKTLLCYLGGTLVRDWTVVLHLTHFNQMMALNISWCCCLTFIKRSICLLERFGSFVALFQQLWVWKPGKSELLDVSVFRMFPLVSGWITSLFYDERKQVCFLRLIFHLVLKCKYKTKWNTIRSFSFDTLTGVWRYILVCRITPYGLFSSAVSELRKRFERISNSQSDCWDMNRWERVKLPVTLLSLGLYAWCSWL